MKKIFILGLSVVLLAMTASAQSGRNDGMRDREIAGNFKRGETNRSERVQLNRDETRYKKSHRAARRDGIVSSRERHRMHKMRRHERRDHFRFRHHRHHRRS